jgi:hypothetical protein
MASDERDLVKVLQAELEFLKKGGYRRSRSARWRPQFIFEDSPTCLNHTRTGSPRPCSECVLVDLVPADCRNERFACRHIPLNIEGFTVDTYYRLGTQEEVEAAVAGWLPKTIGQLEQERGQKTATTTTQSGAPVSSRRSFFSGSTKKRY